MSRKPAPEGRTLLPIPAESSDSPPVPTAAPTSHGLKRKRPHTKVACSNCRIKKWACDGNRPKCSPCGERGLSCTYSSLDKSETHVGMLKRENEALRQHAEPLEELMNILQSTTRDIAIIIVLKLKYGDPTSVLRFIKGAVPEYRPSEQTTACGILPQIHSDLELEFMAHHPAAYPRLKTANINIPPSVGRSPALQQWLHLQPRTPPAIDIGPTSASSASDNGDSGVFTAEASPAPEVASETKPTKRQMKGANAVLHTEAGAQPPPHYVDPRLHDLDVGFWTNVPVAKDLAAGAISLYLETDHPCLGLFDADLFVSSLVSCKPDFCTPFLVSALLAYATQGYNAIDPTSLAISYEFEQEAEGLCNVAIENPSDSLSTLAAFALLWMGRICHGTGKDAQKAVAAGFEMAKRMRLFGVPDTLTAADLLSLNKEDQSATAHTAWGSFNISMVQTIYTAPVVTSYPPTIPIPGDLEDDSLLEYQISILSIPFAGEGDTFPSFCKFWKIASNILLLYRPGQGRPTTPLEPVLSEYRKLLVLADNLPPTMVYAVGAPSHVFIFYIWYHVVILDAFRPFIADDNQHGFSQHTQTTTSPQAIFAASIKQLKQIILVYSDYPQSEYDIWWHISLLYVANAVVEGYQMDPEWRPYFLLCLYCYNTLIKCFKMVQWIVPGLLAMSVKRGAMSNAEAQYIKRQFRSYRERAHRPVGSGAGFVLDMDRALSDWNAAQAEKLAAEFDEMSIFGDFTDGIV